MWQLTIDCITPRSTGHTACVRTSGSPCGPESLGTATCAAAPLAAPPLVSAACLEPPAHLVLARRRSVLVPAQRHHHPELCPPPSPHPHYVQPAAQQQARLRPVRHPQLPSIAPAWLAAVRHQLQRCLLAAWWASHPVMCRQLQLPPNQQHQPTPAAAGAACEQTGTLCPGLQSSECQSAPPQPWPDTCAAPARCRGRSCTACRRGGGMTRRTPPPSVGPAGPGTLRARPRAATPGSQ